MGSYTLTFSSLLNTGVCHTSAHTHRRSASRKEKQCKVSLSLLNLTELLCLLLAQVFGLMLICLSGQQDTNVASSNWSTCFFWSGKKAVSAQVIEASEMCGSV